MSGDLLHELRGDALVYQPAHTCVPQTVKMQASIKPGCEDILFEAL
jgi:hypothetical protein